jgi:hypothetical protein
MVYCECTGCKFGAWLFGAAVYCQLAVQSLLRLECYPAGVATNLLVAKRGRWHLTATGVL